MFAGAGIVGGELPWLFLLLMVGGESVLLPAIRLHLDDGRLWSVMALAVLASLLSDLFWYWVGRYGSRFRVPGTERWLAKARGWVEPEHFEAHWPKLLLLSKFVYGTRTSAQLVCGATRRRVPRYLAVNAAGTTLLVLYLHGLTRLFAGGFSSLGHWADVVAGVLATMACSAVIGRGAWLVYRRRSRSGSSGGAAPAVVLQKPVAPDSKPSEKGMVGTGA